jgi:hypothetical protein
MAFRRWHADFVNSQSPDPTVLDSSHVINSCSSSTIENAEHVVNAIAHAYIIIEQNASTFEHQWAKYDTGSEDRVAVDASGTQEENVQEEEVDRGPDVEQEQTEDQDDRESLDPQEMKSSIYRFLRKLSRYFVACAVITSELVGLIRSSDGFDIKVKTVSISTTTSTPAKENEYPSFKSFFERRVQIDMKSLDPKKVDRLRDSWVHNRESQNLFLHAEMQIALFYALNPRLCPIQSFIGVSKKCCWCCDFVLKSVTCVTFIDPWKVVHLSIYQTSTNL